MIRRPDEPLERYLTFGNWAGVEGGWLDFQCDFESQEEAVEHMRELVAKKEITWWYVLDREVEKILDGDEATKLRLALTDSPYWGEEGR